MLLIAYDCNDGAVYEASVGHVFSSGVSDGELWAKPCPTDAAVSNRPRQGECEGMFADV